MAMFCIQMFLSRPEYLAGAAVVVCAFGGDPDQPCDALHRHRHAGRDGDAAQPLPAFVDCAEPQLQAHAEGQARGHPICQSRLGAGADAGAVCECGHSDCGGGGVSSAGHVRCAAIQDAYKLLSPLLGAAGASTLFAVALLASGQNSSITGTLAGQVVMEGFIHLKVSPWMRRMITRTLAIIPTIIVVAVTGERGTEKLLILSQVILSLQLSFAVVPLVLFTGSRKWMGEFVNARWLQGLAWTTAALIAGLNAWLLIETAMGR